MIRTTGIAITCLAVIIWPLVLLAPAARSGCIEAAIAMVGAVAFWWRASGR